MFINDDDPVFSLPSRLNRTIDDTGGVITLIAEVREKVSRNIRILSFLNNLDPRPEDSYRNAVFCLTGDRTAMTADAASEVDHHAKSFMIC
jgi:hypothetical protein